MRFSHCLALAGSLLFFTEVQGQSTSVHAVYWGDTIPAMDFGFNARMVTRINHPPCLFPDTSYNGNDWRTLAYRNKVAELQPQILRFPGGTNANYWFWEEETRDVLNEEGQMVELQICEGTFIDVPRSIDIGCEGPWRNMTAETFEEIITRTATKHAPFMETLDELRTLHELPVQEMYLLSILDPFYYVGSPMLEHEFGHLSPALKRAKLGEMGVRRTVKQLNYLLKAYCGDCESYDGELLFEIGNEPFLRRYGKFFPDMACMTAEEPCDCRPDINFYVDVCQEVIPRIRERFPNSKVCVSGGRNRVDFKFWNARLVQEFGPGSAMETEAINVHFYPSPVFLEGLDANNCGGNTNNVNAAEMLAQHQFLISELFFKRGLASLNGTGWEVWFSEFNVDNNAEECENLIDAEEIDASVYYLRNWTHVLNILMQFHALSSLNIEAKPPWLGMPHYLNIRKLCLHNLYGSMANAVINRQLDFLSSGMAAQLFQRLNLNASHYQPIAMLNALPASMQAASTGVLQPDDFAEADAFTYTLPAGSIETYDLDFHSQSAFGLAFKSDTSYSAMLVNLSADTLKIQLAALTDLPASRQATLHFVHTDHIFTTLTEGWNNPEVQEISIDQVGARLDIPPFGVAMLQGNDEPLAPCPETFSHGPNISQSCGSAGCTPCNCSMDNFSLSTFEQDMGIWSNQSATLQASVTPLPSSAQGSFPFLGQKALRMPAANAPFVNIVSPVLNTEGLSRVRIHFYYGARGMSTDADRLILSYSNDGGNSYNTLTTWRYGVHFDNNSVHHAICVSALPIGPDTRFRLRARSTGSNKFFIVDNLAIDFCAEQPGASPEPKTADAPATPPNQALAVRVYPNPASETARIEIRHASGNEGLKLKLTDLTGRTLLRRQSHDNADLHEFELPLNGLASGVYFVEIQCNDTRKVVKLKKL